MSEKKLEKLCKLRRFCDPYSCEIAIGKKGGPPIVVKMRGITKPLRAKFYPKACPVRKKRVGGSSKKIGENVHKYVAHATDCWSKCVCKKTSMRSHKYARGIMKALKDANLKVLGAEVPIGSLKHRIGTKLDLVCRGIGGLVIVSLKTGRRTNRAAGSFKKPLNDIAFTEKNCDQLQAACELAILREYHGIKGIKYVIIVGDDRGGHVNSLTSWPLSKKNQDLILNSVF